MRWYSADSKNSRGICFSEVSRAGLLHHDAVAAGPSGHAHLDSNAAGTVVQAVEPLIQFAAQSRNQSMRSKFADSPRACRSAAPAADHRSGVTSA